MELTRIITEPEPTLYALKFDEYDENELDRNFELWYDIEYLTEFFSNHQVDLNAYNQFHGTQFNIGKAINKTLKDAGKLENQLLDIADLNFDSEYERLEMMFAPLNDMETHFYPLQKSKGKLVFPKSWLRIYALRIDANLFVITGGAIKLRGKMIDQAETAEENRKMERGFQFLSEKNLINYKEFEQLEIGI